MIKDGHGNGHGSNGVEVMVVETMIVVAVIERMMVTMP